MTEYYDIHYTDRDAHTTIMSVNMRLAGIARFLDATGAVYPQEIFAGKDNDFTHVYDCLGMALAQINPPPLVGFLKDRLLHILAGHDDIEIYKGDNPVLLKTPTAQAAAQASDLEIAQANFSPEKFALFSAFEQARLFLEGTRLKTDSDIPQPEAIVANTIDLVQGNSMFYEIISGYLGKSRRRKVTPEIRNLCDLGEAYFMNKKAAYLQALASLPHTPEYDYTNDTVRLLLEQQQEFIPLIKTEMVENNKDLRRLRSETYSILGSVSAFYSIFFRDEPGAQSAPMATLLDAYARGIAVGKVGTNFPLYIEGYIRAALKKGITPEVIRSTIHLGLLDGQRGGLENPPQFAELADPAARVALAENLLHRYTFYRES